MKPYDPKKIEPKWQKYWEKKKLFKASNTSKKPKFYSLIEFPFPSGEGMHTGHLRSNTAMDIVSRKRRAQGFNVLYPIGWDAFGLPTENYAIKTGQQPKVVTKKNTDNFRRQLKAAGFSFDWSREVNTTDPKYYKWTQWIFLQMYKHGLAYKQKSLINWCPKDKIGLANEEVIDGKCERCGTPVEKREKEQWMLAITKYADRLDKDLDTVDYLEKIKTQQRNWIGKSEGSEIEFELHFKNPEDNKRRGPDGKPAAIKVFTTRADTLFGVTYIVLSPEHLWVTLATDDKHNVLENKQEVIDYVKSVKQKTEIERTAEDKEKTGVELKGVKAIHPITKEEIPMYVADYVLAHYGTGAVMAVPAHDERDWAFAHKYKLTVKEVIIPKLIDQHDPPRADKKTVERRAIQAIVINPKDKKVLCLRWKKFPWTTFITGGVEGNEDLIEAARREIIEETGYKNVKYIRTLGGPIESHFFANHKDENRKALFTGFIFELENEQREVISDQEQAIHDVVWLTWDELSNDKNIKCSEYEIWLDRFFNPPHAFVENGVLINSGKFDGLESDRAKKMITEEAGGKMVTTYKLRDWVFSRQRYWGEPIPMIKCPDCGWVSVPEKDLPVTLPEVKNYQPTDTGESPLAAITKWVKVKCPTCKGPAERETDTMPNWAGSSWYFLRYTDSKNSKALAGIEAMKYWQPVDWYNGGMEHTTLHVLYSRFWNKFLFDIGVVPTSEPYAKRTSHGMILAPDGEKMSKSRGNVVSPDSIIAEHGADTLRLYQMFMGPFDQSVAWSVDGIVGPRRFLERIWRLREKVSDKKGLVNKDLESALHQTIKKVSDDIETMQFNTAVSAMMIFANECDKSDVIPQEYFATFLQLLAPFTPHIAEELWSSLKYKTSISTTPWPVADEAKMVKSEVNIVVQVNGKMRAEFKVAAETSQADIEKKALELATVIKWLDGKPVKKIIYVKGRLLNIVI